MSRTHYTNAQMTKRISSALSHARFFGMTSQQRKVVEKYFLSQLTMRQKLSVLFNSYTDNPKSDLQKCEWQTRAYRRLFDDKVIMRWIPEDVDLGHASHFFKEKQCYAIAELCQAKKNDPDYIANLFKHTGFANNNI